MNTKAFRQKVLDLAIHGKLVPQNPNDESATVLLEKIRAEKAEKIKKGELKADKKDSFIFVGSDKRHYEQFADGTVKDIEDEIPFAVPEGWAWCRLGEICSKIVDGDHNPPKGINEKTEYLMISSRNINHNQVEDLENVRYLTKDIFDIENKRTNLQVGDILFTSVGSLGRSCVYTGGLNLCFQRSVTIIHTNQYNYWLKYYFDSDYYQAYILDNATGTAQLGFYLQQMEKSLIPLPPLVEQEKIVKSIENYFEQIDYIDTNKFDLQTVIKQAKSKILDLAIHGKLVPQDPNDEPAEELLKRIATSDNRPYEKVEEEPFEIPASWQWALLKNIGIKTDTGYPFDSAKFTTESKNRNAIIRIRDIVRGFSETYSDEVCPDSYVVNIGEILIGMDGDFNIAKWKSKSALLNQRVCRIKKSINEINLDYFFYLLPIPLLEINKSTSSITVKHLSNKQIENMLFPIPPVSEQDRIVKTIEELFSRLDQIQNNIV